MQLVPIIVAIATSLLIVYLFIEAYLYDKKIQKKQKVDPKLLGYGGIVSVGLHKGYCYATIYHDYATYEVKIYTDNPVQCGDRIIINLIKDNKYYYI